MTLSTSVGMVSLTPSPALADAVRDGQWYLDHLKIPKAHRASQGAGVTVAVIDTGVDADHPDLRGGVVPGIDGFSKDRGFTDYHDHGTGMASLIAGRGHGDGRRDGVLGIAPKAKIMPITVMGPGQRGTRPTDIANGIAYAADHGADVILVAMTGPPDDSQTKAVERALAADSLVIASAGQNPYGGEGVVVGHPAALEGVLAVAASDRKDQYAKWSAYGSKIALAAPGVGITRAKAGGGYATTKGTSEAAAIVAGLAALIRAEFPDEAYTDVSRRLAYTAVDKGDAGRDWRYGFGVPDVNKALSLAEPPDPPADPSSAPATDDPEPDDIATATAGAKGTSDSSALGIALVLALALLAAGGVTWLVRRGRSAPRHPATVPSSSHPPIPPAGEPPPTPPAAPPPAGPAAPPPASPPGPAASPDRDSARDEAWKRPPDDTPGS